MLEFGNVLINPFPERQRELKTWISETTGPDASIAALWSSLAYFNIKPEEAKMILREVELAVSRWREMGREVVGMSASELDAFTEAFEHPERETARLICTS